MPQLKRNDSIDTKLPKPDSDLPEYRRCVQFPRIVVSLRVQHLPPAARPRLTAGE
jgi:hypothetical protein